ncbi:MAG: hypothetical protein ACQEVA_22985, partial [Myxococcota bacterium]
GAHPGPTDALGCHKTPDGQDFHCHKDRKEGAQEEPAAADDESAAGASDAAESGDSEDGETVESAEPGEEAPAEEGAAEEGAEKAETEQTPGEAAQKGVESSVETAEKAADPDKADDSEGETGDATASAEPKERPDPSELVDKDEEKETVEVSRDELTALRARVDQMEMGGHQFDEQRAGIWLGVSMGAIAISSLVTVALVPPGDNNLSTIAIGSAAGGLVSSSIFSLQMGHRSTTAIAGGALVVANIVTPIIAAAALK